MNHEYFPMFVAYFLLVENFHRKKVSRCLMFYQHYASKWTWVKNHVKRKTKRAMQMLFTCSKCSNTFEIFRFSRILNEILDRWKSRYLKNILIKHNPPEKPYPTFLLIISFKNSSFHIRTYSLKHAAHVTFKVVKMRLKKKIYIWKNDECFYIFFSKNIFDDVALDVNIHQILNSTEGHR